MADVTVTATKVRPLVPSLVTKGVAGAALTLGEAVILNSSEVWVASDADALATAKGLVGIVVASGKAKSDGSVASGDEVSVLLHGRVAGFSGLVGGVDYYLSGTTGRLADTAGTVKRFMGHAEDVDVLYIDPVGEASS